MKIAKNITELIGKTPLVRINSLSQKAGAEIVGKCEFLNPTHSVKDRIAFSMIDEALKSGKITKDTTLIEPTSGNTGIGLASICAAFGIKLILTMPESMSIERRKLLAFFGAKIVLTPANEGMNGAVKKAMELCSKTPNCYMLQQFENEANPKIHEITTAREIIEDTDGKIDILVAAIGTGGTISGVGEVLKKELKNIKIIAVEPSDSAVLSGKKPGIHKIQGIGAGFIPKILRRELIDEIITVTNDEAFSYSRSCAKEEGLLVGISSGANLCAAFKVASRAENRGKRVVTILCDTGERYLSTQLFEGI